MRSSKTISIMILRGAIVLFGAAVLALCVLVLPAGIISEIKGDFDYGPIMLGVYLSAIPLFIALYQSLRVLGFIDKGKAVSTVSAEALKRIRLCAYAISVLYIVGMPYIFYVGDRDDAPGVVALGLVIIGTSFVVANLANVFQKIVQEDLDTQKS